MTPSIADWANFFVAEVGASAALAGLVAVAISINLSRILSFPQLPPRAAESLLLLIGALMLASLGLIPGQPLSLFGIETFAVGLLMLFVAFYNQMKTTGPIEGLTRAKRVVRALVNASVVLPLVAGGTLLVCDLRVGLYFAAVGILISLAAGVWNAWVLLVEIVR